MKILFVDDDEKVLNGILRQQGDDFDLTTALSGAEALATIAAEGPFAVVVSDMRMPEMNGIELLKRVRQIAPDTVRMMLTGFAELNSTIEAINEGNIFRFMAKPCSEIDMANSLNAALRQYALIQAEKELVEGTLRGSVNILSEMLSLVSPLAFSQTTRVRGIVDGLLKQIKIENQWQLEIAAMLSSLGCVTIPNEVLEKKLNGQTASFSEERLFANHPRQASEMIRTIPRLEHVAEIIRCQNVPLNETRFDGKTVPPESRILKLAIEFDRKERSSKSS
ncbi:MAG: response regulator, partial [Planctomycetales bacterium]|nr:response regulator [Planctomycetales bacterium]